MPLVTITGDWAIDLEEGFDRQVREGDVVLHRGGRTVYAGVYGTGDVDADGAIARMIERRPGVPVRTFDRVEAGLVGHAYLLPESNDGGDYWGLNTWTASHGTVACVTFYFEEVDDAAWAVAAWRSIRCREGGEKAYAN